MLIRFYDWRKLHRGSPQDEVPYGDHLVELDPAARTVAQDSLGMDRPDPLHQPIPHGDGNLVEVPLESQDTGNTAAHGLRKKTFRPVRLVFCCQSLI